MSFKEKDEALFAMFDGGRNSEVPKILKKVFPEILADEISKNEKPNIYLKYAFLQAHKSLKNSGQYLGSSGLVCHIRRNDDSNRRFYINIASCGDIAAVLCRAGEAMCLTQSHTVVDDREEASRIFRSDGIITEDNRVNGASTTSRAIGSCYLYPQLIPEPEIIKKTLRPEDQFLIIANSSLWRYLSHKEAVEEVQYIANPVVAAKRLQDLAQGYGCKENVSVLVMQFNNNALSAAPSMLSINSTEPVFNTLPHNKEKTLTKVNKRPIPAPRSNNTSKNGDSNTSLADSTRTSVTSVDLSYMNIPEMWEEESLDGLQLEQSLQNRLSQVKEREIQNFLQSVEPPGSPRKPRRANTMNSQSTLGSQSTVQGSNLTDSNSTLTEEMTEPIDELETFDNKQAKLPLYSSDTRLMDFIDSTCTLSSEARGHPGRPLGMSREPHHQSDTRLLHSSQIELKSTNYFNRPPLSCSSLEEETDDEYENYMQSGLNDSYSVYSSQSSSTVGPPQPGSYSVYSSSSTNALMRPMSRMLKHTDSRRSEIEISGQSLNSRSPDGSYFSIESEEEEGDIYENVAALRVRSNMLSHSHSNRSLTSQKPQVQPKPPRPQSHHPQSNSGPHIHHPQFNSRPQSTIGHDSNSRLQTSSAKSNSSLTRNGTFYQNYHREKAILDREREMLGGDFDFDIPQMSSNISLLQYDEPDIVVNSQILREGNYKYKPPIKQKPVLNNNTHLISNGSSAYGSGSVSTVSESNINAHYL